MHNIMHFNSIQRQGDEKISLNSDQSIPSKIKMSSFTLKPSNKQVKLQVVLVQNTTR